jgi:hypothetical protein
MLCATAVVLGLAAGQVAQAQAASYFVRPTGNDSASGTSEQAAWRTLGRVSAANLNAGDTVLLQGGAVFAGQLRFGSEDAGTSSSPVTVASYGSGRATITPGDQTGLQVENAGGFSIHDVDLHGSSRTQNTGSGIHFTNTIGGASKLRYVRIDNVDISKFGNSGILVEGHPSDGTKSGWQDVEVTDCVLHDNEYAGMLVTGTGDVDPTAYANRDVHVRRCRAFDNPGDPNFHDNNSGHGIVLGNLDGGTIERSIAYNNGFLCGSYGGGPVGLWTWQSNNVTIQYNESYSNRRGAAFVDGGGLDLDGGVRNSRVQYNYTHDNDGPGILIGNFWWATFTHSGNVVRYNVSVNDARTHVYGGIHVHVEGKGITDTDIYNNTVYQSPASTGSPSALRAEWYEGELGVRIRNNLLITKGGLPVVDFPFIKSGLTFQGNDYWSSGDPFRIKWGSATYQGLPGWRSATGQERLPGGAPVGLRVAPSLLAPGSEPTLGDPDKLGLLHAYRIRNDSPLRDAGLNLASAFGTSVGSRDYFGSAIPQYGRFDVGAHEFSNPVANDGFETGAASPWTPSGAASVVTGNARRGTYAARLSATNAGVAQTITGLRPNTQYKVSAQLKQGTVDDRIQVGIKDYGGPQLIRVGDSTTYVRRSVSFTTGPTNTTAVVFLFKRVGSGTAYGDEVAIEPVPAP